MKNIVLFGLLLSKETGHFDRKIRLNLEASYFRRCFHRQDFGVESGSSSCLGFDAHLTCSSLFFVNRELYASLHFFSVYLFINIAIDNFNSLSCPFQISFEGSYHDNDVDYTVKHPSLCRSIAKRRYLPCFRIESRGKHGGRRCFCH